MVPRSEEGSDEGSDLVVAGERRVFEGMAGAVGWVHGRRPAVLSTPQRTAEPGVRRDGRTSEGAPLGCGLVGAASMTVSVAEIRWVDIPNRCV